VPGLGVPRVICPSTWPNCTVAGGMDGLCRLSRHFEECVCVVKSLKWCFECIAQQVFGLA